MEQVLLALIKHMVLTDSKGCLISDIQMSEIKSQMSEIKEKYQGLLIAFSAAGLVSDVTISILLHLKSYFDLEINAVIDHFCDSDRRFEYVIRLLLVFLWSVLH